LDGEPENLSFKTGLNPIPQEFIHLSETQSPQNVISRTHVGLKEI
jgi:hypothetical protein